MKTTKTLTMVGMAQRSMRALGLLLLLAITAGASGCVVHSHARASGRVAVRPAGAVVVRPARVWVPGHFRGNLWIAGHWR